MKRLLTGFAIIFSVHALTSFLVTLLPNAASIALGILGGNRRSLESFWSTRDTPDYPERLHRLFHGELGMTLDNSPVVREIGTALEISALPVVIAIGLSVALAALALKANPLARRRAGELASTASLLPPFVFPFLIAPVLFMTRFSGSWTAAQVALIFSIVLPLTVMIVAMLVRFHQDALNEQFQHKLALNGLGQRALDRLSRLSAWFRVLDVLDRIVVAAIVSILLAEPLFGLAGIGTLAARAVRTGDPNLTVATTTAIAVMVVAAAAFGGWLRLAAEAWAGYRFRSESRRDRTA